MTIKPIKSDNSEPEVNQQHREHRECLNKISSPKSPSTQHGIEQRNSLRNTGYGVDDVVVNRHRRTNQKSGSSHGGPSNSNTQKHHKQRLVNINSSSTNGQCSNDSSGQTKNEETTGNNTNTVPGSVLPTIQSTSSNVITNSCFIAGNNSSNNLNSNSNLNNNGNSSTTVNLNLKNSPDRGRENDADDDQNNYSGYNSGDEHHGQKYDLTPEQWEERDKLFVKTMNDRGFVIEEIVEDGACLFRSISLQIYGDQGMHEIIRQQTMDYIYQNREYFMQFVTEDIDSYVSRKRNNHVHGNHIEIQAISEIFNRPVEIYAYHTEPVNIFGLEQIKEGVEPLRLLYQRGSHYNAILNPYKPTVGLGLGLSGYRIVDESPNVKHLRDAVRLSEDLEIEQTMFEDKLKTTDWEATNEAIEEQIARESYLQWCREKHQKPKQQNVHNNVMQQQQLMLSSNTIQSSSTITSTTTGASVAGPYSYTKLHSKSSRDSDDSASCESADYYSNNSSPAAGSSNSDDRQQAENSRSRKRRSHRRKASQQNVCNAGIASLNEVATSYEMNPNSSYVMNSNSNADASSPSKKRKVSSQDLPGPSTYYASSNDAPMSEFYQSLLQSSYQDDLNCMLNMIPQQSTFPASQLSEEQMIEKALQMSRIEFMQSKGM
ncbi:OVARIAN TUMOR DOMAIN-containing deubiquitinating enzyme 6 isoform X2 [Contarinia nasturtii]|uniref:OVARIAN TUMOR DOMAIN-containing deubiquitinating enzyme 6 isoform X2 n=1 Tax=Contarinia nasturtii TaxID=265458 RepID=UPI0012D4565B|nr:OVARIAN TUMOR DOMAIN-containing deubiquitinating enzyme 6 isoform X2 [Contarinia nasturtii]